MNQGPGDHWRGPGGPPQGEGQPQGRPFGSFGPNPPPGGHVLPPPPPSSYHGHHSQPSGGHSMSIADLTQSAPPTHQYNTQPPPPPQSAPHHISSLPHTLAPHHSPQYLSRDRERELREREMRDAEMRERDRQMDMQRHHEMMLREREEMERLVMQRQQQQRPVQSHAGSIPIHQPVAKNVQTSIHGPNGLLSNGGAGPVQQNGLPTSTAPSALFGAPVQHESQRAPPFIQQVPPPPQPAPPFMAGPSPMPAQPQLAHGQQPILNDALSYLDQVKVRFSDQPDVYNRFLDIMKDFKSQAIDTPGVIDRVSNLFNGHPALIQGFNTFLPPGYRIECGTEENPDAIRVTTPSGTMTQSLQRGGRLNLESAASTLSRQDTLESNSRWSQAFGPQISPNTRTARLPYDAASQPIREEVASAIHQQEQKNVANLQNAVSAATGRAVPAVSPGPGQQSSYGQQGGIFGGGDIKRGGPVEFNHAISYVNKIKNRFAQQPEIYKQFLEILQTYQRESKPIQDVYAQVTQLFISAPDLLEDFKQFLPETAAHAKAQATARAAADEMSSSRELGYGGVIPQAQTPRPAAKMPPMGQFDPPSTSKEHKKRRGGPGGAVGSQAAAPTSMDTMPRGGPVQVGNASKRQKLTSQRQAQSDTMPVSPTLIPQLPEPLPPYPAVHSTQEELGFFERVKKFISNRSTYNEFMKLLNLYTQDLIDKYTLADRVMAFIGGNPELSAYFRNFMGIEEQEEFSELRARPDPGRVNLAHCRALGPSYRHLPKREQNKPCKGRDGMCYEVLNDVWASHPTWASEDSGFVAHRKNQYEEALHRIEEERHDYDFHIESCQRTIQLMEPLVQQISVMNEADRIAFRLAVGLGGASEAIPKRTIMKVYGREVGNKVLIEMYNRPCAVLPIVLARLKQKLEEWKHVQREWEKVWRDQIHKQFWKSLDHQGINAKNSDKKNFQQKTLVSEIQAKYEEGKKNRDNGIFGRKHQLEFKFEDHDVIGDAAKLVMAGCISEAAAYSPQEQERITNYFFDFFGKFFGLDPDVFKEESMNGLSIESHDEDDAQESDVLNPPKNNRLKAPVDQLRRQALDRRNGKMESAASSRGSTPIPDTMSEIAPDDELMASEPEAPKQPWINLQEGGKPARQLAMNESYERATFNCYANANIYCFFRLFEMLVSRLVAIKKHEAAVREAVARHLAVGMSRKPAIDLKMIDKGPEYFFDSVGGTTNYYSQIIAMCEGVFKGEYELSHLEETLRRYYNKTGWQLYTVDKLVLAILRFAINILGGDVKDKSVDITNLFTKDREKPDTTRAQEIQYRKQVERLSKDGEVFRISYTPNEHLCTIRLFPSDDATFDHDALSDEARWQYYNASFAMRDQTEGVDMLKVLLPYLRRCIPPQNANIEDAYKEVYGSLVDFDEQYAFLDIDSYKLHLTGDFGFHRIGVKTKKRYDTGRIEVNEKFHEKFVQNVSWMRDQVSEVVEKQKRDWDNGVQRGEWPVGGQAV